MEKCYYEINKYQKKYIRFKSRLDVILAGIGLVVLSPVFFIIILAIKLEDGLMAPIFFSQKRVGIDKELFDLYKFRSMKLDTPHDVPTHLLENPEQYITKVGKFLRKTSLDELPQLINILRGDMLVIGSRPALYNQDDLIAEREKYGVHQLKPGLTGWAQIHGRDELEIEEKAKLDAYYLRHVGPIIDIRCFFGTIIAVFKSDGVVEGGTGEIKRKRGRRKAQAAGIRKTRTTTVKPQKTGKKKILVITNHSYMLWRFRRELIQELMKKYTVVISTPFVGHENDFKELGCEMIETPVDRRGINPATDLKLFRTYVRILKEERPNMVLTYSIKPNIYAGFACQMLKIPYCVNVQGLGTAFQKPGLAQAVTLMYKMALKKAKTVFFENEGNAELFRQKKITPKRQQTLLPGAGVNLEYYPCRPYPENDKTHFLYLGRIMKEKGMDELFYAVSKLHEKYGDKMVLDLVGFFEDEYKEQVEELVQKGIAVFHGFQEEPRPYYEAADCVVLPSYHEGMSNVLLEAAATGRAIITSDIPGCREAVEENVSGFLCRVKDKEDLLRKMEEFMELSQEERAEMGLKGRLHVEKKFDKERVVRKTCLEIVT